MKKIVFQVHEMYRKAMHGRPLMKEHSVSLMPVLDIHNKPIEFATYPEAEAWIDAYYSSSSIGSSKEFQIQKIYKSA